MYPFFINSKTLLVDKKRTYKSCSDLPIYNFHQIIKHTNYLYLFVDYDEYEEGVGYDEVEMKKEWDKICLEYCDLTDDNASWMYYQLLGEINYLEVRKYIVSKLIQQLITYKREGEALDKYIEVFKLWKYTWDSSLEYEDAILKLVNDMRANDNKIGLKKSELTNMKTDDNEPMTLTAQVTKLELALEKNLIDPKTTSVLKWVEYFKRVKERNDAMKKRAA